MIKLNLGCGTNVNDSWVNIDGSIAIIIANNAIARGFFNCATFGIYRNNIDMFKGKPIVRHDLRKPLTFAANSVSAIYASHFVEHLYYEEAYLLLKECYRVLADRGICRVVIPDGSNVLNTLSNQKSMEDMTEQLRRKGLISSRNVFMRTAKALFTGPLFSKKHIKSIIGSIQNYHEHKSYYSAEFLIKLFSAIGFVNVAQMSPQKSRITDIEHVESIERSGYGAIVVEGEKHFS